MKSLKNVNALVRFARRFSALGDRVGEQVEDLLNGDYDQNPNALRMTQERVGGLNEELDEFLRDCLVYTDRPRCEGCGVQTTGSALCDASNAEDAAFEMESDPALRGFASRASRSLGALHGKVLMS